MFGVSEAVAGSFGFGQQHMAYDQQKRMQSRQYGYDKSMAEYAYSKELEQWHRANEYNNPTSQMARLKAAGLNPNLIYGQSSGGAAGQAATLPKYQAPRYPDAGSLQVPGFGLGGAMEFLGQAINFAVQKRQADKLQADKDLVEQKAATEAINRVGKLYGLPGIRAKSTTAESIAKYSSDVARENLLYLRRKSAHELKKQTATDAMTMLRDQQYRHEVTKTAMSGEEFRRYRQFGMTSNDAIQWRVAVNLLRAMGVNLSDPNSLFGK